MSKIIHIMQQQIFSSIQEHKHLSTFQSLIPSSLSFFVVFLTQRAIDIAAGCHTSAEASRAVVHAALDSLHRLGMGDNVTAVVCFLPVPL